MTIIEVDKGRFVNLNHVFRIDLIQVEKSDKFYVKFYSENGEYSISKEFHNEIAARDWLTLSVLRSSGTHEILEL
jgi:hypothetical protein